MIPEENIRPPRPIEEALSGIVRLLKAVGYYPAGHPSLQATLDEARKAFAPVLAGGAPLMLEVRREGFLHGERLLAPTPLLKGLAAALFARKVESLALLPELTADDLFAFSRALLRDPADLLRQGGLVETLRAEGVRTVRVNETELARLLDPRGTGADALLSGGGGDGVPGEEDFFFPGEAEPWGEEAPFPGAAQEGEDLFEVLAKLRREESDARFRELLQEAVSLLEGRLVRDFRYPALEALEFLLEQSRTESAGAVRREDSLRTLRQLATGNLVRFLVDFLCDPEAEEDLRRKVLALLLFCGDLASRPLMERLTAESAPQTRRSLMEALVALDAAAVPVLREHLRDGRWFVVRNAAAVLGEIRRPETADTFPPLLSHPDLRVRREAVRALTRIGGPEAVSILLRTVEGEDPELSRQALLSLGALRHSSAVPTLLRLAARPDPFGRRAEIRKGAIRALGEIGSADAVPLLEKILRRRPLWRRALADEVRAAAAAALGEIAGGTAALEKALEDRSAEVARAASHALKSIRKGHHGSGAK